jgi:hypothetical protein
VSEHVAELRQRLAGLGEIDPENIFIVCSHTHIGRRSRRRVGAPRRSRPAPTSI